MHAIKICHFLIDIIKILNTLLMLIDCHVGTCMYSFIEDRCRCDQQYPVNFNIHTIHINRVWNIEIIPIFLKCIWICEFINLFDLFHQFFDGLIFTNFHRSLYSLIWGCFIDKATSSRFASPIVANNADIGRRSAWFIHIFNIYNKIDIVI